MRYEAFARSAIPGEQIDASVADFLTDIPYLLIAGIVPPLHVVNNLLAKGISDAGMSGGCRWEPFELTDAEWQQTRAELEQHGGQLQYVEPPDWVATLEDWQIWIFDHVYGVPAQEHRPLAQRDDELARAIEQAAAEGDEEKVIELHLERYKVGEALADLFNRTLRRRS